LAAKCGLDAQANFLWGGVESVLLSRGTSTLQIRKFSTGFGSYLEAGLAIAYGLAPNPIIATVVYGIMDATTGLHGSGGWSNYMEGAFAGQIPSL
jgi:hypothetical protein